MYVRYVILAGDIMTVTETVLASRCKNHTPSTYLPNEVLRKSQNKILVLQCSEIFSFIQLRIIILLCYITMSQLSLLYWTEEGLTAHKEISCSVVFRYCEGLQ